MDLTDNELSAAAAIVSAWNWQVAEGHRYRFAHATNTIIRFYESAPMEADVFRIVLAYLRSQENVTSIELNGKVVDLDGSWKAKDAWYQTANGDKFDGTDSNRVRVYQSLVGKEDGGSEADGPYVIEDGCQYKVSHEFYWEVDAIPTLTPSTSGVSYVIQGLTRDKESGQYSCVIEKRERVQQDIEFYDSVQTIFEHREDAVHLGVRADDVEDTGLEASAGGGVRIERHLSKNPDCTTDVSNVRTTEQGVEKASRTLRKTLRGTVETTVDRNQETALTDSTAAMVVGETRQSEKTPGGLFNNQKTIVTPDAAGKIDETCTKTIFEHVHNQLVNQEEDPNLEHVDAAAGGVVKRVEVRKTEEGTFDVSENVTTEQGVEKASRTLRKTLRGTVETTVDRNQSTALTDSTAAMVVGETRQSEKTPGGLFNNQKTIVTPDAAGKIDESCSRQSLEHQHSETVNQDTEPTVEQQTATVNVVNEVRSRKTEEGNWDVQTVTRTMSYKATVKTWTDDIYSHVLLVYNNATTPITCSAGGTLTDSAGVTVSIPVDGASISCSYTQNSWGSYNGTVSVRWALAFKGQLETLYWEKTTTGLTSKVFYVNKEKKLCYRTFTCTRYECYGPYRSVIEKVADGENCEVAGWTSGHTFLTKDIARGRKFSDIVISQEMPVDDPTTRGDAT